MINIKEIDLNLKKEKINNDNRNNYKNKQGELKQW